MRLTVAKARGLALRTGAQAMLYLSFKNAKSAFRNVSSLLNHCKLNFFIEFKVVIFIKFHRDSLIIKAKQIKK